MLALSWSPLQPMVRRSPHSEWVFLLVNYRWRTLTDTPGHMPQFPLTRPVNHYRELPLFLTPEVCFVR